jgi:hypothetical protein
MATLSYDEVWEAVRAFSPDELRRLRNLVDTLLDNPTVAAGAPPLSKEQQVVLQMLKDGLVSKIPRPMTEEECRAFDAWKPVDIEGEPLSETIIRERR